MAAHTEVAAPTSVPTTGGSFPVPEGADAARAARSSITSGVKVRPSWVATMPGCSVQKYSNVPTSPEGS